MNFSLAWVNRFKNDSTPKNKIKIEDLLGRYRKIYLPDHSTDLLVKSNDVYQYHGNPWDFSTGSHNWIGSTPFVGRNFPLFCAPIKHERKKKSIRSVTWIKAAIKNNQVNKHPPAVYNSLLIFPIVGFCNARCYPASHKFDSLYSSFCLSYNSNCSNSYKLIQWFWNGWNICESIERWVWAPRNFQLIWDRQWCYLFWHDKIQWDRCTPWKWRKFKNNISENFKIEDNFQLRTRGTSKAHFINKIHNFSASLFHLKKILNCSALKNNSNYNDNVFHIKYLKRNYY